MTAILECNANNLTSISKNMFVAETEKEIQMNMQPKFKQLTCYSSKIIARVIQRHNMTKHFYNTLHA